ncbi:hypothetical protein CB0940_03811 [Cercospora beticola]|uniref:Uncharacterized protein n=1 Tax=Cercospora beticola TaxID=122368 RepID=A0A2G5I2V5_CERBT|nr:hypothetical protein CB0940_03811 [Cercospora beticola]PIA99145.1 hypothetical protein CB0940_03811 [Cercospora beticola]
MTPALLRSSRRLARAKPSTPGLTATKGMSRRTSRKVVQPVPAFDTLVPSKTQPAQVVFVGDPCDNTDVSAPHSHTHAQPSNNSGPGASCVQTCSANVERHHLHQPDLRC